MKIELVENSPMKVLLEDYYFEYQGKTVKIPMWYAFDGLSIPRPLQWLVDMNYTENIKAWVEHDFLYSKLSEHISNRDGSDAHLYRNVKASKTRAVLVYLGVYFFGKPSYRTDSNFEIYKKQIQSYREAMGIGKSIS